MGKQNKKSKSNNSSSKKVIVKSIDLRDAEPEFKKLGFWKGAKIPFMILLVYTLFTFLWAEVSFNTYQNLMTPIAKIFLDVVVYLFSFVLLGIVVVRSKGSVLEATKDGILLGALIGIISATLNVLMVYTNTQMIQSMLSFTMTSKPELSPDQALKIIKMGTFSLLIFWPSVNALLGGVLAAISGGITKLSRKE
ncbi:MAG: hypothetical protein WC755_00535 [Candidatus Woesearchaeota archaeon]|jgi:hypothetical protein